MRTVFDLLFLAMFGTSSAAEAASEARSDRKTSNMWGTPPGTARNSIAALAFMPPHVELTRMENSEAASSAAAAALKVARLAATTSLALALILSPPPALAAEDVAHGSRLFNADCAVCHPDGRNRMNSLKTLRKEALERYQSLQSEQLATYVSSQWPHTGFPSPTIATPQDYNDVIAFVLDQAINNKWK